LHCAYGEDLALLTAFALFNQAHALFAGNPELSHAAAQCIGLDGMIGGQALDLRPDSEEISLVYRDRKTSGLMRLALTAGAMAQGASLEAVAPLAMAGQLLGQAYQILDDLLDTCAPGEGSGKTAKQDTRHGRPSHRTRSDAMSRSAEAQRLVEETRRCLLDAFGPTNGVTGLTLFIDTLFESLRKRGEDSRVL
jgi:geranylgeranyl diphosphate synthase type II